MIGSAFPDAVAQVKPPLSVIIPVHNGGENFRKCLVSVAEYAPASAEIIIVVDGGTDNSLHLAEQSGYRVVKVAVAGGPAQARNLGARIAQGDILFFMDADVTINATTLSQVVEVFKNADVAAMIGSYDDAPGAPNFLSQYKNLFHHYTHQTACEEASTFWGACGAIRREIFLAIGGFDAGYRYPSIEDIELGYRLKRAGYQIQLCKSIQVKHLKRWEVIQLLKAEFFYRALPWTELIWRDRQFVNDLNLKLSSRVSLVLTYGLLVASIAASQWAELWIAVGLLSLTLLVLNWSVYRFFQQKRGLKFALQTIPWHWLYFFYSGLAFAIGTVRHLLRRRTSDKTEFPI